MTPVRIAHLATIVWLALTPQAFAIDGGELKSLLDGFRTDMKMPGLRAAVRFPSGRIVRAATGLGDVENEILLDD
ncbi:MAG: hypothetical protein ACE5F8_06770, partial [Woeseiaceae bacterium]